MSVRPIRNMVNHETNEVFFEDFEVPAGESDRTGRDRASATSSTG